MQIAPLSGHIQIQDLSELVPIALFLSLALGGLDTDFLVILLQRRKVFAGLGKFALFHSFADVPMHKCTLRVHQVELMIDAREDLSDSRGVADHATSAHHLGQVAARDNSWRLVVDAAFKTSGAPIDELDCTLRLDSCHPM